MKISLALLTAAALVLIGCGSTFPGVTSLPADTTPSSGRLRAGAARADLTPRPGFSTYGYGPDARVGSGYWTRLQARAFYFETDTEPGVALVSCDLHSISALLQRRVAERLREGDGYVVHPSRLMIAAIHAHAAPSHYWDAALYNDLTSTRYPGYSEEMMEALVTAIADAVRRARANSRPARIRWTREDVWALTYNRSLDAFRANAPPPTLALPGSVSPFGEQPERQAIDPALRVLEIEEVGECGEPRGPIGLISFFAMHPTVLASTNHLFGADLDGVAEREIERDLRGSWRRADPRFAGCVDAPDDPDHPSSSSCPDPVAALVNTNEGDMVPVRAGETVDDVEAVGERFAAAIRHARTRDRAPAAGDAWRRDVLLDFHSLDVSLPGATLPADADPLPSATRSSSPVLVELCPNPALGVGVTLASPEHPSSLVPLLSTRVEVTDPNPGWSPFHSAHELSCQVPKRVFVWGDGSLAWKHGLPGLVKVGLLRFDDRFIAFVPAEMTVAAGALVDASVLQGARLDGASPGRPRGDAVVAGLSNAYLQYITTRAEYPLQRYEGASTLYGPGSAEFFARVLRGLAEKMVGAPYDPDLPVGHARLDETVPLDYALGPSREPMDLDRPAPAGGPREVRLLCREAGTGDRDPGDPSRWQVRPRLCMTWSDAGPATVPLHRAPWVELVRDGGARGARPPAGGCPEQDRAPCAQNIDDRGDSFLVRAVRLLDDDDTWLWALVFRPRQRELDQIGSERVRIQVRGLTPASSLESDAFSADGLPRPCTTEEALRCGLVGD